MTRRETVLLALIGLAVWLSGAVMFRLGGRFMLESGFAILAVSGVGVAFSVCFLLRAVLDWRGVAPNQAVRAAVVMILPGLFADVAYILAFTPLSGLAPASAGPYAAVILFGNAAVLTYALIRARPGG